MGRAAIIDATKLKVLPDPDAPCLGECNKSTATRVLATAIYSKLERKYFDNTHSRMEVSMAFHYNVSQLTKALTGVEYHSGPHHYKPKPRESRKRTTNQCEVSDAPRPQKTRAAPNKKTSMETQQWQEEHFTTFSLCNIKKMNNIFPETEDTLESESSSDRQLPEGLPT